MTDRLPATRRAPTPSVRDRRLGLASILLAGVALAVAGCQPDPKTTQGVDISNLYAIFLGAGMVVGAIVWVLATIAILRGRRRRAGEPAQTHGDVRIEALWTVIPLVTVLVLFGLTVQTLDKVDAKGTGGVNLHVTAFRWQWQADYADAGVRLVGTVDQPLEVVLPVGQTVHVTLDSVDVNHAFYVPAFLFKRDAIPGSPTAFDLQVSAPGVYPGACAEFCGIGHAQMPFTIRGVDQATFDAWLAEQRQAPGERRSVSAIEGRVGAGTAGETAAAPAGRFDLLEWLTTTDHKRIGILYITSAFGFAIVGGLLAEIIRLELAAPGRQLVDASTYDQLFTVHGTLMLLFFAGPLAIGFANAIVPLQIGAADMAFPRLNALSFWLFLFGGLIVMAGFLTSGGAAAAGWTGYVPLSNALYSPQAGMDLWIVGVALVGFSGIFGALNLMVTIYGRRAPGMHMFRMPMFTWTMLVTSVLILFAFPSITAALAMLLFDRHLGGGFFDPTQGGAPILWQHLFWFFGHPEVYILVLPYFGIVSEVIPVFSGKPLFGYRYMVLAVVAIAALSMGVWAHHMFTTGLVSLPFFSLLSLLIAVPTGIKIFNWVGTMWGGRLRFPVPMLWCIGVIYVFTIGGITGVMLASPPIDYGAQDTYFVVAHMHNVLIGGSVFAGFAGIYFWFPKLTGRMLSEALGRVHVLLWVVGFALTFVPQYILGAEGMPRRIVDYPDNPGWAELNLVSTIGALLLAAGMVPFFAAVVVALRRPADAPADPWGGNSLEWATSSPPPHHNFDSLPPIRSERPVYDARVAARGADSPKSQDAT